MKILLGISGSVAAKLTPKIQKAIIDAGHEVKTIATSSSLYFRNNWYEWKPYYVDSDEWEYYKTENKVLHIDLVQWADKFIIAPCTANTLAKIANGISDNLLTSCFRAWNLDKEIYIAPAMNTRMWESPFTNEHVKSLKTLIGAHFIPPVSKELFCGDTGIGAMADIGDIMKTLEN